MRINIKKKIIIVIVGPYSSVVEHLPCKQGVLSSILSEGFIFIINKIDLDILEYFIQYLK
tara:strand:- start:7343 stop:7522 length:180 start_codon:yes stop_codon:yes gene_type:complete